MRVNQDKINKGSTSISNGRVTDSASAAKFTVPRRLVRIRTTMESAMATQNSPQRDQHDLVMQDDDHQKTPLHHPDCQRRQNLSDLTADGWMTPLDHTETTRGTVPARA